MLDSDLAKLYGVETRILNQAVKRNASRFEGDDFMFRLTKDEALAIRSRSQFVTLENTGGTKSLENEDFSRSQCDVEQRAWVKYKVSPLCFH